jgi:hypothetical protein
LLIPMCGFVAFGIDVGYMGLVRGQLQNAADAGALATAQVLYPTPESLESEVYSLPADTVMARQEGRTFVGNNYAAAKWLDVDLNTANDPEGDIVIGRLYRPWDQTESLKLYSEDFPPNTVQVRVPMRDGHVNGRMPLFFAAVFGMSETDAGAFAMATVQYPSLLPFATTESNWHSLASGGVGDNFAYTPGSSTSEFGVSPGADGTPEIVMFPGNWNGEGMPPGNFGIVDIGPPGDTMVKVRRQIDMGPSQIDMDYHGGSLHAPLDLSGLTGIKSSSKHTLLGGFTDGRLWAGILGQVRQMPLYDTVTGNGTNATFHITRFVTVRVMALAIDGALRTSYRDTEGSDITAIVVQPVTEDEELFSVYLTR